MRLTVKEIMMILDLLKEKHGGGYAEGDAGKLQAKSSIMAQVASQMERSAEAS